MLVISWKVAVAILSVLASSIYWLYWRWSHRDQLRLAAMVPGPPTLPLLGNALQCFAKPTELLSVFSELMDEYGEYMRMWLGPELHIFVKNATDIRLLLTSNKVNLKGPSYKFLECISGPGILTGGPTWRDHRKIATPSYNKKAVHNFSKVFNEEGQLLAQVLLKKDPKKTFNVYFDVLEATTQSVCQTLMGLSKEESKQVFRLKEVILHTQSLYTLIFMKMTRWWYQIPFIYWLIGCQSKENYYAKIIDDMVSDIVMKRKRALSKNKITCLEECHEESLGIVDRYILSGALTDQEIKWETFTLFTTSQEAAAKITSGVLLVLAHLPDWQDKVYNEIIEVIGQHDEFVSDEDLKKLNYLDMVYKEVLRYLAIAAMIQRNVEEDVAINNGKLVLPKGTTVILPIHELHRDPRYWEQPNKVMPERFLPENCKNRDPNAFVPFSWGPMDCLGRVYATALIKTLVVRVLRHVILEAEGKLEDLDIHVAISVRFANGYNLRVRPRTL